MHGEDPSLPDTFPQPKFLTFGAETVKEKKITALQQARSVSVFEQALGFPWT